MARTKIEPGIAKTIPKCRQLSPAEKEKLFNLYIKPNLHSIWTLTQRYTNRSQDYDDNYSYCLTQLYHYIGSYNPSQKLSTWIHICVKRACFQQNNKRTEEDSHYTDIEMCTPEDLHQNGNNMMVDAQFGTLIDNISDEILSALMQIPPQRLSPFLMYVQGCKIRKITAIEWEKGHLEQKSASIVQSRIYWAKRQLQFILRENGIGRYKNYKSTPAY